MKMSLLLLLLLGGALEILKVRGTEVMELEKRETLPVWGGTTVYDLHREYNNIFKYGNRNAASHLWSSFLLDRASQMSEEKLKLMFSGYCAVSGSPVNPSDYNRYRLTLPLVSLKNKRKSGYRTGYMHYCCWPCVCDTQDFIKVDTKTITLAGGINKTYHFAVLGNPCDKAHALDVPFTQPFYGGRQTTLRQVAPEVRCQDGVLQGATLSDGGYIIISMFFDTAEQVAEQNQEREGGTDLAELALETVYDPTPGRVSTSSKGELFSDEREWKPMCQNRADNGYNSGMGEIFRKVASISRIEVLAENTGNNDGDNAAANAKLLEAPHRCSALNA